VTSEEDLIAGLWREVRGAQLDLVHRLVADVASLEVGRVDPDTWERIRDAVHRLAGTLGSFHQQPAGDTAVALEELTGGVDGPDAALLGGVRDLTAALHAAFPHGPEECPHPAA
jgi:hypothetical protein